jgi:hypothetical protein
MPVRRSNLTLRIKARRHSFTLGEAALSEQGARFESVKIPGELGWGNPIPPPIAISLPILARPRRLPNILFGLIALVSGLTFAPMGVACLWLLPVLKFSWDFRTLFADAISVAGFPLLLPYGVMLLGAAVTCFRDALRSKKIVLEVTADGLHDHRSGLNVPWSSVQCADIAISGGDKCVDLQLRGVKAGWQNPFRIGVLFHRFWLKPDHVIVPVCHLNVRSHILIHAILTLVHWHGGATVGVSTYRYSSLIPRPR